MKATDVIIQKDTYDNANRFIGQISEILSPCLDADELYDKNSKKYKTIHIEAMEKIKELLFNPNYTSVFRM